MKRRDKTSMNEHPSEDQLLRFQNDALPEADAAQVEDHLEECLECRDLLDALSPFGSPDADPPGCTVVENQQITDPGAATMPSIPGYEILAELGRGGMGVVYKARQVKAERIVALKMILSGPRAGPAELARFRTEVRAAARLNHPGSVSVYEVGEHSGLPYFSLEYCPDGTLKDKPIFFCGGAGRSCLKQTSMKRTLLSIGMNIGQR
jgi:serine/threonine protein kinase